MKGLGVLLLLGVGVFIVAPLLAEYTEKNKPKEGAIEKQFKTVCKTPEAKAVFDSEEFQKLIITPEFIKLGKIVGLQVIIEYLGLS